MDALTDADQTLRFGQFELHLRSRELRNGATSLRLQEQPFEILRMMLERPGLIVTREELQQRLWPDGTFVDFEHSLNAAVKRLRAALGDDADNPRFVETLPRRGYRLIASLDTPPAGAQNDVVPKVRLAVLPFSTLGQETGQEYFADGLTEEMISQLGQLYKGRVGVIARWSSMVFKGTIQRSREIGQALRADYLLEGSVRREGDRVRITATLVEASSETHLWSESYERPLTNWLAAQADVAERIAQSLAVNLTPEEPSATHSVFASTSAYQEYLKGRHRWNFANEDGIPASTSALDQALACFNAAIRMDPRLAPGHAMVARVHIARAEYYLDRPRPALETARSAVKRALDLDPRLSEAHLALGDIRRMLEWDWHGAEAAYAQAIALNPSQENAHRRRGTMLVALSRAEEAVREAERARELDPLCRVVTVSAASVRYLAEDYHTAMEQCRRAIDMDPQYLTGHRLLAAASLQTGRVADAVEVLDAAHAAAPHDPIVIIWLAHARAVAGDRTGATSLLAMINDLDRRQYVSRYHLAIAHAGLGDLDAAFAALEQATVDADPELPNVVVEPRFAPLRPDPRYVRLVELLGLE